MAPIPRVSRSRKAHSRRAPLSLFVLFFSFCVCVQQYKFIGECKEILVLRVSCSSKLQGRRQVLMVWIVYGSQQYPIPSSTCNLLQVCNRQNERLRHWLPVVLQLLQLFDNDIASYPLGLLPHPLSSSAPESLRVLNTLAKVLTEAFGG